MLSATYLAIDPVGAAPNGCQSNVANVTTFPAIPPGTSAITSADCNIVWGSTNNDAMLRVFQADGTGSAMLRTTGAAWAGQTSTTTTQIRDIDAVDDQVAWVVGDSGLVAKTTDGGTTWVQQTSGVAVKLAAIDAVDANTAYAVGNFAGSSGVFIRTTNGGTTWTVVNSGTSNNLLGIVRTDATHMWAVGDLGEIIFSANGGTTWTAQSSGTAQPLLRIRAVDSTTLYAVGYNGTVTKTTNGGTTWTAQSAVGGVTSYLRDLRVFDANNVWIVGVGGNLLRSTNGGSGWTASMSGTTDYYGIAGTSMSSATIVGTGGVVKSTADGGATWTIQPSSTTDELRAVHLTSSGSLWSAGVGGTIIKSAAVPVPNYDDDNVGSDDNWTEGTNMFGACLETATNGANGGAGVSGWTVAGDNNCTTASAAWNPIAATSGTAGSKVAATSGPDADAAVSLRFGFKTAANQLPGSYEAPLIIEVIAPNL